MFSDLRWALRTVPKPTALSSEPRLLQYPRWWLSVFCLQISYSSSLHIHWRNRSHPLNGNAHIPTTRSALPAACSPSPSSQLLHGMIIPASIKGQFPHSQSCLLEEFTPQSSSLYMASLISPFLLAQFHQHQWCPGISDLKTNEPKPLPSIPCPYVSPS